MKFEFNIVEQLFILKGLSEIINDKETHQLDKLKATELRKRILKEVKERWEENEIGDNNEV